MSDGRPLQNEIIQIANVYRTQGVCVLHKVDPPLRVVGKRPNVKVIFLDNPFLDFVGAWKARGGRAIVLEAKQTEEPKLTFGNKLTDKQIAALRSWHSYGAAVGVLWMFGGEMRYLPIAAITARLDEGIKHVKWEHATEIPRGLGFITWDFMRTLADYYPC